MSRKGAQLRASRSGWGREGRRAQGDRSKNKVGINQREGEVERGGAMVCSWGEVVLFCGRRVALRVKQKKNLNETKGSMGKKMHSPPS